MRMPLDHEIGQTRKGCTRNLHFLIDLATIAMVTKDKLNTEEEPHIFQEAWNNLDTQTWKKCREAIKKELNNMTKKQAWHKITKNHMLPNCQCMKCKWVLKIKCNSVYKV